MSAIAFRAPSIVRWDALRDSRHPDAKAAREQAEWLLWLELGNLRPRTLHSYQWTTDFLLKARPRKAFAEFTDSDVMLVLRRFPVASQRTRAAAFKSWFKWGRQTRRLTNNPMDFLPEMKRTQQPLIDVFTAEEQAALCALPSPDGNLMTLLFEAGIRKGEARHLTGRRLNFDTGHLVVIDGSKGGKQRAIPMEPRLIRAMSDMLTLEGIGDDDYLWYHKPGGGRVQRTRPIGEGTFHRWWVRCIEDARIKYRKPHTTRHTFATRWRKRGLDLDDIQILLGHANISTTSDLYVHRTADDVAEKMAVLRDRTTD